MSLLRDAQKRLAKALLKQRLKAQGVPVPPEAELDRQTERLLDEANRVLKSEGKRLFREAREGLKSAIEKHRPEG